MPSKVSQLARKRQTQKRVTDIALAMAATIPNQETLDDVLLREADAIRRNTLFEFMKPALRFANPICPEVRLKGFEC